MTIRANDAWNQHLEEMNRRQVFQSLTVHLVRIEGHVRPGWAHTEHVHPYWQLEVVERGGFSIRAGGETLYPKKGDIIFIPPQCTHYFDHPKGKKGWTFKFSVEEMTGRQPVGRLGGDGAAARLHASLLAAVTPGVEPSETMRIVIEHLIAAALTIQFGRSSPVGAENEIIGRARRHLERRVTEGRAVKVRELAEAAGCSMPYMNRVFRRHLGVPVKVFVDQYRFETARKLLLDSSANVTEIATDLGFDDSFRFSRFFKRLSGEAPSAYRRLYAKKNAGD